MTELDKRLKCEYAMRAGKLLHDRNGNADLMLSNHNVTNELAVYHLATNPGCEIYFSQLAPDWQEQVLAKREELKLSLPEKPKEKVIPPPPNTDIDETKEAELAKATDPETLDNTVSIEKNPAKPEKQPEPIKPKNKGGRPKKKK